MKSTVTLTPQQLKEIMEASFSLGKECQKTNTVPPIAWRSRFLKTVFNINFAPSPYNLETFKPYELRTRRS